MTLHKPTIYMLIGCSGSGKTFHGKELIKRHQQETGRDCIFVSKDEIRESIGKALDIPLNDFVKNPDLRTLSNRFFRLRLNSAVNTARKEGKDVIVDAINLTKEMRSFTFTGLMTDPTPELLHQNFDIRAITIEARNLELLKNNVRVRHEFLTKRGLSSAIYPTPDDMIEEQFRSYERPTTEEGFSSIHVIESQPYSDRELHRIEQHKSENSLKESSSILSTLRKWLSAPSQQSEAPVNTSYMQMEKESIVKLRSDRLPGAENLSPALRKLVKKKLEAPTRNFVEKVLFEILERQSHIAVKPELVVIPKNQEHTPGKKLSQQPFYIASIKSVSKEGTYIEVLKPSGDKTTYFEENQNVTKRLTAISKSCNLAVQVEQSYPDTLKQEIKHSLQHMYSAVCSYAETGTLKTERAEQIRNTTNNKASFHFTPKPQNPLLHEISPSRPHKKPTQQPLNIATAIIEQRHLQQNFQSKWAAAIKIDIATPRIQQTEYQPATGILFSSDERTNKILENLLMSMQAGTARR